MLSPKQITAVKWLHWTDKWPVRQIERHLRISRKTIRKYLLSLGTCPRRSSRAAKLELYKPILDGYVRTIRPATSGPPGSKQEAFDWMRALLQSAIPHPDIKRELKKVAELDKLLIAVTEGRLSMRNKAIVVLARARGIRQSYTCSFLYVARKTAAKYWHDYQRGGVAALFARKPSRRQKSNDGRIQEAVFSLLHSPPSAYGFNRSTWRLTDLQTVLRSQGQPLCRDLIAAIIKQAGYRWRKARVVLTSGVSQSKHYYAC